MEGSRRNLLFLARRQQCACLIQEIGSRLPTTQVVINTSLYYMHHFYEIFTPETIKPIMVALASFYIACKTEDFSRKLSLLVGAAYGALRKRMPDENSDTYKRIVQNIHSLEATILMVIGFQTLEVKQPHVILINVIRENKFPKEISHTSYYVCTNILHLTTLVLRHSMDAIAATSLYIASKWNNFDIVCADGEWYRLFSPKLSMDEIKKMTDEFTQAFQQCDVKIKEHLKTLLKTRKLERCPREDPSVQQRKINENARLEQNKNFRTEKRTYDSQPVSRGGQRSNTTNMMSSRGSCNEGTYRQPQQQPMRNGYGESESKSQRLGVFSPPDHSFQMPDSATYRNVRPDGAQGMTTHGSLMRLNREGSAGDSRWPGGQSESHHPHLNAPVHHRATPDKMRDGGGGQRYPNQSAPRSVSGGHSQVSSSSNSTRPAHKNDFENLF